MAELKFSQDHEWIRIEDGDQAVIGITDYAQQQLGDVVFVELPEVGKAFAKGEEVAVVESVKAAAELYAPLGGEVVEVNGALDSEPGLVNTAPEDGGWFIKLRMKNPSQADGLMDRVAYDKFVADAS